MIRSDITMSGILPELRGLTKRSEFVMLSRASYVVRDGFVLQGRKRSASKPPAQTDPRHPEVTQEIRVGFTCSKKLGNAVARNRAKRRLRGVARAIIPQFGHAGWDYVLVGRAKTTISLNYTCLADDLRAAMYKMHG